MAWGMNILSEMLEIGRHASETHTRIVKWRPTEGEAWRIATQMELCEHRDAFQIYEQMKTGRLHLFGARIEIRA